MSHGQQALILPLLEQLDRWCKDSVAKVVLTVNIAEPDLLAGCRYSFPIERIENPHPKGFGANHNAAFAHCDTAWFLVLNPDMRLDRDVLASLTAQAVADSGVLAPRIFEPGKTSAEPHRRLITPQEILHRHRPHYDAPVQPTWIPGMFMLFRAPAFRAIGGFDERFFMYGEDFDICARLRLAGWQIQVDEELHALHAAQRASRRQLRHLLWHFTSLARVWRSGTFWRFRALLKAQARPA